MTPKFVREYTDGQYTKSSKSAMNDCVMAKSDQTALRDSKDPDGQPLQVKRGAFRALVASLGVAGILGILGGGMTHDSTDPGTINWKVQAASCIQGTQGC